MMTILDSYKSNLANNANETLIPKLENSLSEIDQNESEYDFDSVCEQIKPNFESGNFIELKKLVENIKEYASQIDNPILIEFEKFNLAFYLTELLDIDETTNTAVCISYCLAHEDDISTYFIENNFIFKAAQLLDNPQFVSPILSALGNIAASSYDNIDSILNDISYYKIIDLSALYQDDEKTMEKISRLLMNISQKPPVPAEAFHFFTNQLYNSQYVSVRLYILWCLHHSLMINTNLSDDCCDDKLIETIIELFSYEDNQDFLYIEIKLLTDLIQIFPDSFNDFDLNQIIRLFDSENKMIVKSALHFFEQMSKKKINRIIEDDFLELYRNILSDSSFKIKYDIFVILAQIISDLDCSNLVFLINQGVVEILNDFLEFEDTYLYKQFVKSLRILIDASFLYEESQPPDSNDLSPSQHLRNQIDELNIYRKLEGILENTNDHNLEFEINQLFLKYNPFFGIDEYDEL